MAHYTAVLEITKTTPPAPAPSSPAPYGDRRVQAAPPEGKREVVDVARLVIRAESIEQLRSKIAAHAELIEG